MERPYGRKIFALISVPQPNLHLLHHLRCVSLLRALIITIQPEMILHFGGSKVEGRRQKSEGKKRHLWEKVFLSLIIRK